MGAGSADFDLSLAELRDVAAYAIACARPALSVFAQARPDDPRPRSAIETAEAFADGGRRTKAMRDAAWAAQRAAQEARKAGQAAAGEAARAALLTASAGYLHPLAEATQVEHILGPAARTARALELAAGDDPDVGDSHVIRAQALAGAVVLDVLRRYPTVPPGGGRVKALLRALDAGLR